MGFKAHLEIARDVEERAPNAWLFIILISNPMFELTTLRMPRNEEMAKHFS